MEREGDDPMKCHICGRENASIHIREIRDGERKSYYICKECAAKQSGAGDIMGLAQMIYKLTSGLSGMGKNDKKEKSPAAGKKDPFAMDMGIGGIIELFQDKDHPLFPSPGEQKKEDTEKLLRCPFCGWGTEQLKKTGHLGCPECYQVFAEILKEKRSGKYKTSPHIGKHPGNLAPELLQEIEEEQKIRLFLREKEELLARMKSDIQSALAHEDYEKAALLRDQIRELEKELTGIVFPVREEENKNSPLKGETEKKGGKKGKNSPSANGK